MLGELILHALPYWLLPQKLPAHPSRPIICQQRCPSWLSPGVSWALSVLVTWRLTHVHLCQSRTLGLPSISSWASVMSLTSDGKPDPWFLTPPAVFLSLQALRPQAMDIQCLLSPTGPLSAVPQHASSMYSCICHHVP